MVDARHPAAENARLMRQFGDDLRTMPALWRRYRRNADAIRRASIEAANRRRYTPDPQEA